MASSSYTSEKWRTGVSDFESLPSYRKRDDAHSPENSQRLGLSGCDRQKSRGSVIFEDDALSLGLRSHDKLVRDSRDFGSDINSQKPTFLKSSLGSRRFGLQESDQLNSFGEEEDDLRLKLNTEMNYSSPRYGRTGNLTNGHLDQLSARKSQAEYRSDLLSLQSSTTPRGEIGHSTKKSLRLPSGLDKEGAESFRDSASLRSSVRFSDEVDKRTRLTGLDGDRKYSSDLRDGLSSMSPRIKSRLDGDRKYASDLRDDLSSLSPRTNSRLDGDRKYASDLRDGLSSLSPRINSKGLENLGSDAKFRKTPDYEEGNQRLPKSLSKLSDQDRFDMIDTDKRSVPLRSSLTIREDPFAQSRSYRQEEDVLRSSLQSKDSPRSYSFKSRMPEDFEKLSDGRYSGLGIDMDSTKYRANSLGHLVPERPETSQSRLLNLSSRDTDLDLDRTAKLKLNKNEELYAGQKSYSSPRTSDTGALRSRDATDIRSELQMPSRSSHGLRPSDVERKRLLIEKELDHRDQNLQMLAAAENQRKSILNQDHRSSLFDSRSMDLDENLGTLGHSYQKLHDVELGSLRRSALLDDNMGERKQSILLSKENQIVNGNLKAYESLVRNSEFEIKERRDGYGSRRKELTHDFLSANRSLSNPSRRPMADITGTKYKLVEHMIQMAGFSVAAHKDADFSVIWNDSFVSLEKISALGNHQRINHFAGMGEICNQSSLAKNIARLKSRFPSDYGFFPRSWVCPEDAEHFQTYYKDLKRKGKKKCYITKPIVKSKESGVRLYVDAEKIPVSDQIVIQEFLNQPLLINRRKFHLCCFVLVTSCDPLHVYLYSNGMACLASEPYMDASETNLDQTSIHITNDTNERCSLRQLLETLHQSRVDTAELWKAITDIIIKTLILAHPHLCQNYKLCRFTKPKEEESVCFEILGFDFLIDKDIKPWLLKVNQSPSFSVSDDLDKDVKPGILEDALQLVSLSLKHSRPKVMTAELAARALAELYNNPKDAIGSKKEEKERTEEEMKKQEVVNILERIKMAAKAHRFGNSCGGYKQIFPPPDKNSLEKYLKLMESAHVFIPGPDDKRRQEVKQFLIQREKDRLQAVIRRGPTPEGSQRLHASKLVKIDIGEDMTGRTLKALNEMQITIPGKTEKAAAALITKVRDNWKLHKPKMAEFWFVHLDLSKREKVINIVKNKVHSIAQSTWCTADVENVGLYRIFLRLFNRLLAHHGRGLWDCFHSNRNSWEMIFTKATEKITSTEMSCCRRIVQLCCDCLCIVYICTPQQS